MSYRNNEEVSKLSLDELNPLLLNGNPQERVWAAWSIGLRTGKESADDLERRIRIEPNPGTRRHMMVVLVGFGKYEVIKTLAIYDPDEFVRATAVSYLIKITEKNDKGNIKVILDMLLEDESWAVQEAVISNWGFDEKIPLGFLLSLVKDEHLSLSTAVIEQVIKRNEYIKEMSKEKIIDSFIYFNTPNKISLGLSKTFLDWIIQSLLEFKKEKIIFSILKDFNIKNYYEHFEFIDECLYQNRVKFSWKQLSWLKDIDTSYNQAEILCYLEYENNYEVLSWLIFRFIQLKELDNSYNELEWFYFNETVNELFNKLISNIEVKKLSILDLNNFKLLLNYSEKGIKRIKERENVINYYDDGDHKIFLLEKTSKDLKKWIDFQ